jgi:hypothetical protein
MSLDSMSICIDGKGCRKQLGRTQLLSYDYLCNLLDCCVTCGFEWLPCWGSYHVPSFRSNLIFDSAMRFKIKFCGNRLLSCFIGIATFEIIAVLLLQELRLTTVALMAWLVEFELAMECFNFRAMLLTWPLLTPTMRGFCSSFANTFVLKPCWNWLLFLSTGIHRLH